ncbi:uncharacterized protein LOC143459928 [Clavelina lepadiformis]|uniref:uncharacterized protein LOC143459928 n=1 Tax=Clavelina lepadiformis TaxID=159417 RepID=UPI004041F29F
MFMMNDCDPPAYSQTEDESSALPPSYEEAAKGRPRWVTENMEAKHRLIQEILNVPRQLPADRESSMSHEFRNKPSNFSNVTRGEIIATFPNTCFRRRRSSFSWLGSKPIEVTCPACDYRVVTKIKRKP